MKNKLIIAFLVVLVWIIIGVGAMHTFNLLRPDPDTNNNNSNGETPPPDIPIDPEDPNEPEEPVEPEDPSDPEEARPFIIEVNRILNEGESEFRAAHLLGTLPTNNANRDRLKFLDISGTLPADFGLPNGFGTITSIYCYTISELELENTEGYSGYIMFILGDGQNVLSVISMTDNVRSVRKITNQNLIGNQENIEIGPPNRVTTGNANPNECPINLASWQWSW